MLSVKSLNKFTIIYLVVLAVLGQFLDLLLGSGTPKTYLCLAISIFYIIFMIKRPVFGRIDFLAIGLFVVFLHGNQYLEDGNTYGIVRCAFIILFLIVCKLSDEWPEKYLYYSFPAYLVHVLATIWLSFDSVSYYNLVLPLFPAQRYTLISQYENGQIAGLTTHYSTNGMYIACAIILLFVYYLNESNKKKKKRYFIFLCLAIVAVLITGKRAHVIFTAAAMLITYNAYAIKSKRTRIFKIFSIIICGLLIVYIGQLLFPNLFSFVIRFEETAEQGDISLGRFETWAAAINLFRQNPIVGIGWRKFYELSTVYGAYNFNLNTHNVYIQLLCETGVLGAIIYFSWFVMLYIKTYKLYKKFRMGSTRDVTRERCLCFSLCLQSFFLLYCLTGNPLYDAPMFIPYFVSCGITLTYERNATISTSTSMDNRKI